MTNTENTSSEKVSKKTRIDAMVAKAIELGHDSIPSGTSELEITVVEIFRQSKKIMTAKEIFSITAEKDSKWYSDKLWALAKKGILIKMPTRGYYKYNPEYKGQ